MANKPPAFQFYAKDWRSSMTVARMSREQRSIFVDMMAIAWDSEEPGTIDLPEPELCRELGILKRTLRRLLREFPASWRREGRKLVQPKLHEQWVKYKEISTKRSAIAQQMHMQKGGSAFAVASASASATENKDQNPAAKAAAVPQKRSRSPQEQKQNIEARGRREYGEEIVRREVNAGRNWISDEIAELAKRKAM